MIFGTDLGCGCDLPFSQFSTDHAFTLKHLATCFCVSPNSILRFLICSPKVLGEKSNSFILNALSITGTNGRNATRLCPCGYLGHHNNKCRCTPDQVARYRARISGPLLDRIDLHIEVPALREDELTAAANGEASFHIRARVDEARQRQTVRQGKPNAMLGSKEVDEHCAPDEAGAALLKQAIARLNLSARAYHRILKVARSIADLAGSAAVKSNHIAEAIQYRRGDTY